MFVKSQFTGRSAMIGTTLLRETTHCWQLCPKSHRTMELPLDIGEQLYNVATRADQAEAIYRGLNDLVETAESQPLASKDLWAQVERAKGVLKRHGANGPKDPIMTTTETIIQPHHTAPRLYLAHPFGDRHAVRTIEQRLEHDFMIEMYNPFYDRARGHMVEIDGGERDKFDVDPAEIVEGDLAEIDNSAALLAVVCSGRGGSFGAPMEIFYAARQGKPVYIIAGRDHRDHPWLRYHARRIYTDWVSFEQHLSSLWKQHKAETPSDEAIACWRHGAWLDRLERGPEVAPITARMGQKEPQNQQTTTD